MIIQFNLNITAYVLILVFSFYLIIGWTIGTAEQQTIINLVPPGQVIKVDVSKSKEYASLDIASSTLGRRGEIVGGGGVSK